MHDRCLRIAVVFDRTFVETVEKLAVDQAGRLPSCITVLKAVAEILAVFREVVEVYADSVGRAEHHHRRGEVVAVEAHLQ